MSRCARGPECTPFKNLCEVLQWEPDPCDPCIPRICKRSVKTIQPGPKWLVCHDMAGGYLEDRFVQGVDSIDCYRFYNWSQIDIFVYFSHHFVTIPPPCWTTAAAHNGVLTLGTVITEWDDGCVLCNEFLKSGEAAESFAKKLVQIASHYRFNGWLVNIENKIQRESIFCLFYFVEVLTRLMHEADPTSQVIWYDSVICTGELIWQNELNYKNQLFFDVCDGIFLNYTWDDDCLVRSEERARQCDKNDRQCDETENAKQSEKVRLTDKKTRQSEGPASLSEGRLSDVYVGVDVFGRGCKGGGGFNTIEAVQAARQHNLSVALFAPGWVYQKLGVSNFIDNNKRFWDLLEDHSKPTLYTGHCFATHFCQGWGHNFYVNGKIEKPGVWTNLSLQSCQPTGSYQEKAGGLRTSYCTDDAFLGGGCLKVSGPVSNKGSELVLFSSSICLTSPPPLRITVVIKPLTTSVHIGLKLRIRSYSTSDTKDILLLPPETDRILTNTPCDDITVTCAEHSTENGWQTRNYMVSEEVSVIENVSLVAWLKDGLTDGESDVEFLLGSLQMGDRCCTQQSDQCLSSLSAVTIQHSQSSTPSCLLKWTCPPEFDQNISMFLVYRSRSGDLSWECVGVSGVYQYETQWGEGLGVYQIRPVLHTGMVTHRDSWFSCPLSSL